MKKLQKFLFLILAGLLSFFAAGCMSTSSGQMVLSDLNFPAQERVKEPHEILGRFYFEVPAAKGLTYASIYKTAEQIYPSCMDVMCVTVDKETRALAGGYFGTEEIYIVSGLAIKYTKE